MAIVLEQEITNAGGTFTFDPQGQWGGGDAIIYLFVTAPVVLASGVNVTFSSSFNEGATCRVIWSGGVGTLDINGTAFTMDGAANFPQWLVDNPFVYVNTKTATGNSVQVYNDIFYCTGLNGDSLLLGNSVSLDKLKGLTSGKMIVGNSSDVATSVIMSGDATISNTGALTIANSAITNAKVSPSAAIARTKIANGTANHVLINDGSGVMSSEATLAKSRGGFGQSVAASTGIVSFSSGTLNIGAMAEVITIPVSFESGEQCENCVKMPYAGTVTEIYAVCTKAIAGTDDATITAKNNAGTTMTGGVLTFTASDPLNTAYDVSPSANNTFVAGDVLQFVTAKTTSGGKALVSIKVTRNS